MSIDSSRRAESKYGALFFVQAGKQKSYGCLKFEENGQIVTFSTIGQNVGQRQNHFFSGFDFRKLESICLVFLF
jgi:hypothetical protein